MNDATAATARPPSWGLLSVLAATMLIDALEVSLAVVALPSIGRDLHLAPPAAQWVMTGFALGFGGLLLFGTRLVALRGRRPVYLAALLVFAAASVLSAVAGAAWLLVAMRCVKGFCAALTAPTGLAIIGSSFPEGPSRDRAVSVYTLFGAGGFSTGLLLSGLLGEVSWRLAFAVPGLVVLVLLGFAWRLVPADRPANAAGRRYGVPGAVTLTGALLALVSAVAAAPDHGWWSAPVAGWLATAAVLLAVFLAVERAGAQPLVAPGVLAHRPLVRSAVAAAGLNGSYLGLLLLLSFHLQGVQGWSPLRTGLAFLPASVPLALTALSSGRMVRRFGAGRLTAAGLAPPVLGYALLLRSGALADYATGPLPALLLVGAGFVLAFAALNAQAVSGLPAADRAAAVGLYQTGVQAGAVLVPALVAALLASGGARWAVALITSVGLLGLLAGLSGLPVRRAARPSVDITSADSTPAPIASAIERQVP